jgi:hypothetical protein
MQAPSVTCLVTIPGGASVGTPSLQRSATKEKDCLELGSGQRLHDADDPDRAMGNATETPRCQSIGPKRIYLRPAGFERADARNVRILIEGVRQAWIA